MFRQFSSSGIEDNRMALTHPARGVAHDSLGVVVIGRQRVSVVWGEEMEVVLRCGAANHVAGEDALGEEVHGAFEDCARSLLSSWEYARGGSGETSHTVERFDDAGVPVGRLGNGVARGC